ncbi:MAG: DUF502 domain-containing protein [Burkholderiaceae bacterium]
MIRIQNLFVQGLAALLPIAITLYLIYWLGTATEDILGQGLRLLFPDRYYLPGMGIGAGILLAFATGIVLRLWIGRKLLQLGERVLRRVPVVKTIYSAARDFTAFWTADKKHDNRQVVLVTLPQGQQLIGFITQRQPGQLVPGLDGPDLIAVYLPMSYQIGGYTVYMPASQVRHIDMSVEDAMRITLTAAMSVSDPEKSA